jgi:dUTP pyrophosphatase
MPSSEQSWVGSRFLQVVDGGIRQPAYDGDCGYDLFVESPVLFDGRSFNRVKLKGKIAIPKGYWGLITPRSSTNAAGELLCLPGVIDSGYRGELFALVHNLTDEIVQLMPGDSPVQLILMPVIVFPVMPVDELPESERGDRGFGSSNGDDDENLFAYPKHTPGTRTYTCRICEEEVTYGDEGSDYPGPVCGPHSVPDESEPVYVPMALTFHTQRSK